MTMLKYMEKNCIVHIDFQHNQLKMLEILSRKKYLSVENKDFSGDEFHHCLKYIYFKKNILSQIPFCVCVCVCVERMQKIVTTAYNM